MRMNLQSWTKLLRKCHILRAFFLTSSLYRVLPSPLPLEAMLLCVLKQPWSLDICRKQHWPGGRGIWYRRSVVVEIVLLRLIVCMEGYKFSSSFVRDCRLKFFILKSNFTCNIQCIRELSLIIHYWFDCCFLLSILLSIYLVYIFLNILKVFLQASKINEIFFVLQGLILMSI